MKTKADKNINYKIVVEYHPEDDVYFAHYPELPGCKAHGNTAEKAVRKAEKIKVDWLEVAKEEGWKIPEPALPLETSGRITLRIPKSIHKKLVDRTEDEGVSLNQLILTYVSIGIDRESSNDAIKELCDTQNRFIMQVSVLKQVSTMEPMYQGLSQQDAPSIGSLRNEPIQGWEEDPLVLKRTRVGKA